MIEVLLVDDESYVTESLKVTIPWGELGVNKVHQAESAAEALELMERHSIDILVTDIQMPEVNGLQLIELVQERWPNVRCILLTGHSEFHYAKKAIELHVLDYVLKPVDDEEFIASLSQVITSLQDEWAQAEQYYQLMYDRKTDLSILRRNFLHELLLGRPLSKQTISERLVKYEIPLTVDTPAVMMLVKMGLDAREYDEASHALLEYAAGNIAEEVLSERFHLWHAQSPHSYMTIIASLKPEWLSQAGQDDRRVLREELERLLPIFRQYVRGFLKVDVAVAVTNAFNFPEAIASTYRAAMRYVYMLEMKERDVIFLQDQSPPASSVESLDVLYRPPTLLHLLEAQQWDAVRGKLDEVFDYVAASGYSRENLYEIYLSITNAIIYAAHKYGLSFSQIGFDWEIDQGMVHSLERLRHWTTMMVQQLEDKLSTQEVHAKTHIVNQVKQIVSRDLGSDISVKTIADRVYLHPVYLSKVFKSVTGESLGDYIIRMRMEKALYMLKHTNKRIYEITMELGYQNPQYFSKMFKKYYGMTPNEYRDGRFPERAQNGRAEEA